METIKDIPWFELIGKTNEKVNWISEDFEALGQAFGIWTAKEGKYLSVFDVSGELKSEWNAQKCNNYFKEMGGQKLIYELGERSSATASCWVWKDSLVSVAHYGAGQEYDDDGNLIPPDPKSPIKFILHIASVDEKLAEEFRAMGASWIAPMIKERGKIYVLEQTAGGIKFTSAGFAGLPLIEENYTPEVLKGYNHLLEDIRAEKPCGRLTIIDGEPGTGKTHLVRSLLEIADEVMFVVVRPDLIANLTDPSCISALLKQRGNDNRPIVFVLEDADNALIKRGADNMHQISGLLNTSDGILGATLDMRIICTTNGSKIEFDKAVMRPGRLCTHIHTNRLTEEHAVRVFTRLLDERHVTNKHTLPVLREKGFTLADIYKAAFDIVKN